METYTYSIDPWVFERFPGYQRGVLVAENIYNGVSPDWLKDALRSAEADARRKLNIDTLTEHPHLSAWRDAFRAMGVKPADYRPSIEAMLRRTLRGLELPFITALVDIGNTISLRHVLPVGCHASDVLKGDICLRPATGQEDFLAFGSNVVEHPEPGEIIFVEGSTVLTRRWIWRQADYTLTLPESIAVEYNIDGLPPVTSAQIELAARDIMEMVKRFCGGEFRFEILSADHPSMTI